MTCIDMGDAGIAIFPNTPIIPKRKRTLMHQNVKPNWTKPQLPDGYDTPAVCWYGKNVRGDLGAPLPEYELDFFSNEKANYASEVMDVVIEYPWTDGYAPTVKDWEFIGFEFHDFTVGRTVS
jgi:hypothetical protein